MATPVPDTASPGRDDLVRVSSGSPFEPTIGFSRAVRLGDRVLVSGTGPVPPPGEPCPEDAGAQARRCFAIVETALREAGAVLGDVVRTRMYITDVADAEAVGAAHGALFAGVRPAATMVVVAALLDPAWKVEVEAEAIVRTGRSDAAAGAPSTGRADGSR
jgi:enamine deaminase RidA (YjgF/YER057c/UK114 family)